MPALNKESSSINAEMHATATAPILADSFQYRRLFRVVYHKERATAANNSADRSSTMIAEDSTCSPSQIIKEINWSVNRALQISNRV